MNIKEIELVEKEDVRQQFMDKLDVLEKVKDLVTLPNTELLTTKMVADWYEVTEEVIRKTFERNKEELVSNGTSSYSGKALRDIKSLSGFKSRARSITIFTKRSLLNIGMLLRDSKIAKQVRRNLLDAHETTSTSAIVQSLDKEKELALAILFTEDDVDRASALANFRDFKNRHIMQLEEVIQEQRPKVEFHDHVKASINETDMLITAKSLGIGYYKLLEFLRCVGVLFKQGEESFPKQRFINDGFFNVKINVKVDKYNRSYTIHTTKTTGKGKVFIFELLNKFGGAEAINKLKLHEIKQYIDKYNSNTI